MRASEFKNLLKNVYSLLEHYKTLPQTLITPVLAAFRLKFEDSKDKTYVIVLGNLVPQGTDLVHVHDWKGYGIYRRSVVEDERPLYLRADEIDYLTNILKADTNFLENELRSNDYSFFVAVKEGPMSFDEKTLASNRILNNFPPGVHEAWIGNETYYMGIIDYLHKYGVKEHVAIKYLGRETYRRKKPRHTWPNVAANLFWKTMSALMLPPSFFGLDNESMNPVILEKSVRSLIDWNRFWIRVQDKIFSE